MNEEFHPNHRTTEVTYGILHANNDIEGGIRELARRIQERFGNIPGAMVVLTVRAPNDVFRRTARGLIENLDFEWILRQVFMLMEQYGRHDYELDEMEFMVQVIEPIVGGKHNYPILNAHYSRSIIQIKTNA